MAMWIPFMRAPFEETLSVHLNFEDEDDTKAVSQEDLYADVMDRGPQTKLMTVEEKWQIIFNEKTRAPIYAVGQYIEYLGQFVAGKSSASRDSRDVIKKDGINPMSYLLRKLKLDLKMSYESFIDEFLKPGNNGMSLLVKLLKAIQNTGNQLSGSTNLTQLKNYKKTLTDEHDCMLCIKYSLRSKLALGNLVAETYGLETIAMGLMSTYLKSRGTAVEILTIVLSAPEGVSRVLESFTYIRLKIGEPIRFKSLMNMMNMSGNHNTTFQVSCLRFLNTLLNTAANLNTRVFLQHELETAGLDVVTMEKQAAVGDGLVYDDLRSEIAEWNKRYVDIDRIMSSQSRPQHKGDAYQQMVENLQRDIQILSVEKKNLGTQLAQVNEELKQMTVSSKRPPTKDSETQSEVYTGTAEVSVQCEIDSAKEERQLDKNPLRVAGEYLGWEYSDIGDDGGFIYNKQTTNDEQEQVETDEDGVEKVQEWLKSQYDSKSDPKVTPLRMLTRPGTSKQEDPHHNAKGHSQNIPHTQFPGNWYLMPKSIEQFPSRFPQCHSGDCHRCDVIYRPGQIQQGVKDNRSQSSDSAIGGSGDRLWNKGGARDKRIMSVAEQEVIRLQDSIQPEDSASACPTTSEPYPDYFSSVSRTETQKSYRRELSEILREFESNLKTYEEFDGDVPPTAGNRYITLKVLGEI